MDRKAVFERLNPLHLDHARCFVTSGAGVLVHGVPLEKGSVKQIDLVVSPKYFEELSQKHGVLPQSYRKPTEVAIAPGVIASSRHWDTLSRAVESVQFDKKASGSVSLPVLRPGKLLHYIDNIEGLVETPVSDSLRAHVGRIMADCKSSGHTDRQIGDRLGLSDQAIPILANRVLAIKRSEWHSMGKPSPRAIVDKLEETDYNWGAVEQAFFPGKRSPKSRLMKILKGSPEWEAAKHKGS